MKQFKGGSVLRKRGLWRILAVIGCGGFGAGKKIKEGRFKH